MLKQIYYYVVNSLCRFSMHWLLYSAYNLNVCDEVLQSMSVGNGFDLGKYTCASRTTAATTHFKAVGRESLLQLTSALGVAFCSDAVAAML